MTDEVGEPPERWVMPPELDVPLPRSARTRVSVKVAAYIISFTFLALCALIFYMVVSISSVRERLRDYGLPSDGIVVKMPDTHRPRENNIVYKFVAKIDGDRTKYIQNEARISPDDWGRLYVGNHIPIVYDPSDPHTSIIDFNNELWVESPRKEGEFVAYIAISLILSVWGVCALVANIACAKDKRLLQWGDVVAATIVESKQYRVRGGKSVIVYYVFIDRSGKGNCSGGWRKRLHGDSEYESTYV